MRLERCRSARSRALALAAMVGASLCTGGAARANGRYPQANQLIVAPNDPSFLVLRATFGFLYSHDDGQSWGYSCEAVVNPKIGAQEDPSIAATASRLLAGTSNGLTTSADRGCSWQPAIAAPIADLVVRPGLPSSALALTSTSGTDDAGTFGYDSRIFGTTDDGVTWPQVGAPLDRSVLVETIEVARSDPRRVYVSGVRLLAGGGREGVLFASRDGALTFTQSAFPLATFDGGAAEGGVFIGAVDPTDADRVYLRTGVSNPYDANSEGAPNRLLISRDGGKTFSTVHTSRGKLLGFALSPDGATVWIGGPSDPLATANTSDFAFAATAVDVRVQCLLSTGDTLFACANDAASGPSFVIGASHDGGNRFAPLMHLACIDTLLGCPESSFASTCGAELVQRKSDFGGDQPGAACDDLPGHRGGPPASDAGASPDAPSDRAAAPGSAGGGGCQLSFRGPAEAPLEAFAVLALAAHRRRRRSR